MFPETNLKLFNFYRRYKWTEDDFATLQDSLVNYTGTLFAKGFGDAVLSGLNQNGSASLNANYLAGWAVNSLGNILGVSSNGSVAVTNNVKSLIVIRSVTAQTTVITRPTAPFDPVYLNSEQTAQVVAIAGSAGAYPAKAAGDVILFGVIASGGSITSIDQTKCELLGKSNELSSGARFNKLVGNQRYAHYLDLPTALAAAAAGDRIRVLESATINATITLTLSNVEISFDPGVVYTNGTAGTGISISGVGNRLSNGRMTGFTTAFAITGNYNTIFGTRFATNTNDVTDSLGTSQLVGVISE